MKKLLSYFHIVLNLNRLTISEEISLAYDFNTTGNTQLPNMPHSDSDLQAQAQIVQNEIGTRASDPHPALTKQEQKDVDKLSRMIVANTLYIETVSNDLAQGDRVTFEGFVRDTGLTPKAPAKKYQKVAESVPSEAGSFHFRVPAEGKSGMTYYFEYGIVAHKGVMPTQAQLEKAIAMPVTEVIVNGFYRDCWVAIHYTAIKHPKHTKKTASKIKEPDSNRAASKVLTIPTINTKGKIVITHRSPYLQFSDWIYIHVTAVETGGIVKPV